MYQFGGYFQDYVNKILGQYTRWHPLELSSAIGFNGSTASERITIYTPQCDADALIFGANVDFSNANVQLKITDSQTGYVWNILQGNGAATIDGTPIAALAGIQTQVQPILPLICPYFLSRQSKLQMDFRNSATSLTTGGNITWVGLKLLV